MSPAEARMHVFNGLRKDAPCLDVERLQILVGLLEPPPPQAVFVWLRAELAAARLDIGVGPGAAEGLRILVAELRPKARARALKLRKAAMEAWVVEDKTSSVPL